MKKGAVIVSVIVLLIFPLCYAQWQLNSEYVEVDMSITGGINIIEESDSSSIKYVIVNLSFFPRESYRQEVLKIRTEPRAEINDEAALFRWDEPSFAEHKFELHSDIRMRNLRNEIKGKVNFPLGKLPDELVPFTKPSATIDSDKKEIIRLASSLAEGEDDLFVVVNKLAEWTIDNIEYNLSTLTASVTEPASWVLTNRKGVCDEMANLFIAFSRSLGIPAKFVSGIGYTDSDLFVERWGPHGWTEVYFPGYGWVDYDVTYGQVGFIDPTHIELKEGIDAIEPSTKYSWLGRDVNLKTVQLDMNVGLKRHSKEIDDNIVLTVWPEKEEIGFGSYNIINANIKNNNDYYVSEEVSLFTAKEVKIDRDNSERIVLMPKEEKKVSWVIRVGDLIRGYVYTFPVSVVTSRNKTTRSEFQSEFGETAFSKSEVYDIIEAGKEEIEKKYSKDIALDCWAKREEFYIGEGNTIKCKVANKGNVFFDDMEVCLGECKNIELGITQEIELEFEISEDKAGKKEKIITAKSKEATKSSRVEYDVLDKPSVKIEELNFPDSVNYKQRFGLEFLLKKESYSNPVNVTVIIDQEGYKKEWELDDMNQDRKFLIEMKGSDLKGGENIFDIIVNYKDNKENEYSEKRTIQISLINLSFAENVLVLANMLGRNMFTLKTFILFAVIIGIVFIIILFTVFKGKNARGKNSYMDGNYRE